MAKLTLNNVTNFADNSTAVTTTNANNDAIETALENTLSRDGTSPNAMNANLDMNSNRIINLAAPVSGSDAVRKTDIDSIVAAGLPDQTGNSGEFLTTDGTAASWSSLPSTIKVSANDTTAGTIEEKILSSGLVGLTTQNDGANETRTIDVPVSSQAEAEAGVINTKAMTPLRVAQAIAVLSPSVDIQTLLDGVSTTSGHILRYNGTDWAGIATANVGRVAQIVSTTNSAVATGTTTIPVDDSIPQNTEGDQYMSLSITPTNASSTLEIKVVINLSQNVGTGHMTAALFQDSTANALAVGCDRSEASGSMHAITFTHVMTAGTTSTTTFKVRAGFDSAGTVTFNGQGGARRFGGVFSSSVVITEYLP